MSAPDPTQRREIARIAANDRWARPGAREAASRAQRAAWRRRLIAQVDPEGVMPPEELEPAILAAARATLARVRAAKSAG